jgi:MFS family permease
MPPAPIAVLAAAFLFNLGQGLLRPALPLYLERSFAANYRMVTLIPVVFGAGKCLASLPSGYLLERFGRSMMIGGLLLIAAIDIASVMTSTYAVFLSLRGLGGVGWAMFATVATARVVDVPAAHRRGRGVSSLLMSETLGLLLGSAAAGVLYQGLGPASPFTFEAACMLLAAVVVACSAGLATARPTAPPRWRDGGLTLVLRTPGVLLMSVTNAALTAIQTGVIVFLFPLYLATRGRMSPGSVGLVVSLSVLGRLLVLWFGGTASDRWGPVRVLVPGLLLYATWLAGVAFVTQHALLGLASMLMGAAAGVVAALPIVLIGDQVPPGLHGVAIGWLRTMTDTGQILGPLLMGSLADHIDLSAPFLGGALVLMTLAWRCQRLSRAMSRITVARRATP